MGAIDATGWTEVKTPPPSAPISAEGWTEVPETAIITEAQPKMSAVMPTAAPIDSIPMSAAKDVLDVAGNFAGTINQGVMDWVNVLNPSEKNTIYRYGKILKGEYDKGTLGAGAKEIMQSIVDPVIRLSEAAGGVMMHPSTTGEELEKIARKPASFAMDVASILPFLKLGVKTIGVTSKYGASLATGQPVENITARILNSKAIQEARSPALIASEVPSAFAILEKKIRNIADKANELLSDNPTDGFKVNDVAGVIDNVKNTLTPIGKSAKSAMAALEGIKQDILNVYKGKGTSILGPDGKPVTNVYSGKNISPKGIKEILKRLDNDVDWDAVDMSNEANTKLRQTRGTLNAMLKADNPEYANAMQPVHRLLEIEEAAKEALSVKRVKGVYEAPLDRIASKISNLKKNLKSEAIRALKDFGDETGLHIPNEMDNYNIQQTFSKPTTAGARKALMGTAGGTVAGLLTGHPAVGAAVGAAAGGALDMWGGKILAAGIDATSPVIKGVATVANKIPIETTAVTMLNASQNKKDSKETPGK